MWGGGFGDAAVELGEALLEGYGAVVFEEAVGAGGGAYGAGADGHGVGEGDFQRSGFGDADGDFDGVFEGGGVQVAALDGDDWRYDAFGFHAVEAEAELVHPVYASFFHEADVVAVVGDAHAVAFVVFDFVAVGFGFHEGVWVFFEGGGGVV